MAFRVITDFADLQDSGHLYRVGDKYPHSGTPNLDRVKELSGFGNRLGVPLIAEEKAPKSKKSPKV